MTTISTPPYRRNATLQEEGQTNHHGQAPTKIKDIEK
jgi:hypothetical protein